MPKEIELKLRLSPTQAKRLSGQPSLAGVKPQKFRLFNTYYDTPGLDLCQRGVALRLRRKGADIWLMTVKGGDPAAASRGKSTVKGSRRFGATQRVGSAYAAWGVRFQHRDR